MGGCFSHFFFYQGDFWRINPFTGEVEIYQNDGGSFKLKEKRVLESLKGRKEERSRNFHVEVKGNLLFLVHADFTKLLSELLLVEVNKKGEEKIYPLPGWMRDLPFSLTSEGKVLYKRKNEIGYYDPKTGETTVVAQLDSQWENKDFIPQEVDGKIFFATLDGEVYCLDEEKKLKQMGKVDLGEGAMLLLPRFLARNGEIYLQFVHKFSSIFSIIKLFSLEESGLKDIYWGQELNDLSIFHCQFINDQQILIQATRDFFIFDLEKGEIAGNYYYLISFNYCEEPRAETVASSPEFKLCLT